MKKFGLLLLVLCITLQVNADDNIVSMSMNSGPLAPAGQGDTVISSFSQSAVMLSEVPTSTWTYGCSATAAGMMFGYYDRIGYSNMYTGPANGGVAPLSNLGQGTGSPIVGSSSIIATQNGFDGRTGFGHVDDYWVSNNATGPDPWQTAGRAEHSLSACTADYMGTNQWKWDTSDDGNINSNIDGATTLWMYTSSSDRLYDYIQPSDYGMPQTSLTHGMRLFAEAQGYDVLENYTQRIDTAVAGGFSFADYANEIDSGSPVMIQVEGHSMVGVGYDTIGQQILLHDTWDNNVHSMNWGGSYVGMEQLAVTVMHLETVPEPMTIVLLLAGSVALFKRGTSKGVSG